ncbi:MAG: hypothetical protein C0483_03095 [Pirellula sp.]|nr:hypothetical protein [Pirellula sp.]
MLQNLFRSEAGAATEVENPPTAGAGCDARLCDHFLPVGGELLMDLGVPAIVIASLEGVKDLVHFDDKAIERQSRFERLQPRRVGIDGRHCATPGTVGENVGGGLSNNPVNEARSITPARRCGGNAGSCRQCNELDRDFRELLQCRAQQALRETLTVDEQTIMSTSDAPLRMKQSTLHKRLSRSAKSVIRKAAAPLLPLMPDVVKNVFPGLGRVTTQLPGGGTLRLISDGDDGKDYIAYKVAGRSLDRFEPETMLILTALLGETRTFFDVGANTGLFALAAAADPQRRVVGFEPVPQIARRFADNVRLNGFRNLRVEACAVDEADGELTLHIPLTKSSLPTSASAAAGFKSQTYEVRVPAVTLDRYIAKHAIDRVDLIKLDTETTEDRVLRGAAALIRRDAPAIVCEVLHQGCRPSIADVLAEQLTPLGYRYFWIKPEGLIERAAPAGDPTGEFMNYLFITERRLQPVASLIVSDQP